MTYTIVEKGRAIRCDVCKRVSYNSNDIKQLYCGYCRKYHV